jgi:MFS family permease
MTGNSRRWWILGLGVAAQAASCMFVYGLPYLLPELRRAFGLSLGTASVLITCPLIGVVLALIAWGAIADRYGERMVIAAGLVAAAAALGVAAEAKGPVALGVVLAVAGLGGASVFAASGRLVLGWFGPAERGLAMGLRQTAQPLGTMLAAAILPAVVTAGGAGRAITGSAVRGVGAAFGVCAGLCLLTGLAVALFAADPPRPPRPPRPARSTGGPAAARDRGPYHTPVLWRIHGASTLLVVPQFVVTGFTLEYLVSQRGWALLTASRVIAGTNFAGALTRIGAGKWSDLVHSRLRPMRQLAIAIAIVVGLAALGAWWRSPLGVAALLAATALAVSTNGLAFTAVAELAGMSWAGRALGVQNTAQNIAAAATPPAMAQLIQLAGYPASFGITALFPLAAAVAIPASARAVPARPADALALTSSGREDLE